MSDNVIEPQYVFNGDRVEIEITSNSDLANRIEQSNKSKYAVIRDYLVEQFGGQEFVLSDGRKAIMDKRDAQKLSSLANKVRIVQLENLRSIVEKAVYSHGTKNADHKKFSDFYYYAVDVVYDGVVYPIWINVGLGKSDKKNHIYTITKRKEEAPTTKGVSRPVGYAIQNASSVHSISQKIQDVNKTEDKNFETSNYSYQCQK